MSEKLGMIKATGNRYEITAFAREKDRSLAATETERARMNTLSFTWRAKSWEQILRWRSLRKGRKASFYKYRTKLPDNLLRGLTFIYRAVLSLFILFCIIFCVFWSDSG